METRKDKDALTLELKELLNTPIAKPFALYTAMALVKRGADPDTKSDNGDSLLHHLVRSHVYKSYIEDLVDLNANIDIQDANNRTPMECLITGYYGIFLGGASEDALKIFSQVYQGRGMKLYTKYKFLESIENFDKAILADSSNYRNYSLRSAAWRELNEYGKAKLDLEKAIALNYENNKLHCMLGWLYSKELNFKEAIRIFNRCIEREPDHKHSYAKRGIALLGINELEKAAEDFNKVLSLDAKFPSAHYNLGQIYKTQNKLTESILNFSKAYILEPELDKTFLNDLFYNLKADDDLSKIEKIDLFNAILHLPIENQIPLLKKCLIEPLPVEQRKYKTEGECNPLGNKMWIKHYWKECRLDDTKSTLYKICKHLTEIDPKFEWPLEIAKSKESVTSLFDKVKVEEKQKDNEVTANLYLEL